MCFLQCVNTFEQTNLLNCKILFGATATHSRPCSRQRLNLAYSEVVSLYFAVCVITRSPQKSKICAVAESTK